MKFGQVKGTAVCTIKYQGLEGLKLLIVQPLDKKFQPEGGLMVAVDVVQAGPGDLCVMVRSREAAKATDEFSKENSKLVIIGAVMGDQVLDAKGVEALAKLPSLDQLRGKLIGLIQAPATKVAGVLQAPAGQLARVVSAYANKDAA